MPDHLRIELRYSGPEVEDGTLPVEDILDALAGFQDAFVKLARLENLSQPERHLRFVTLEKGSAKVLLDVIEMASRAYKAIKNLFSALEAKKELRGQPITYNNCTIINGGAIIGKSSLNTGTFEVLKSGDLDNDFDRLTAPLKKGRRIDSVELKVKDETVRVSAKDRPFIAARTVQSEEPEVRKAIASRRVSVETLPEPKEVWLKGTFRSHRKRGNSGDFETTDGQRIKYKYVGEDMKSFLMAYISRGIVAVFGTVQYDQAGQAVSIEIREVEPSAING